MKKVCPNCGKEFETKTARVCCSCECTEIYNSKRKHKDELDKVVVCTECGFVGDRLVRHIQTRHGSIEDYCKKFDCSVKDIISERTHKNISDGQKFSLSDTKSRFSSINNPSASEDCKSGRNSPYSLNFRGYDGLTIEEKKQRVASICNKSQHTKEARCSNPRTVEYYIKQGLTKLEAKQKLGEVQRTFTLEKCKKRYGEDIGKKIWEERQIKWQNSLKEKSDAEKERIQDCRIKGLCHITPYSRISQDLFCNIYELIKDDYKGIFFGSLNNKTGCIEQTTKNYEYRIKRVCGKYYFLDFFIKDIGKIIEFDGTYWHNRDQADIENDEKRDAELMAMGYKILRVKEKDYLRRPSDVVLECLKFIKS